MSEFLPFVKPYIDEAAIAAVGDVLRSGWITSGPKMLEFEKQLSAYFGTLATATTWDAWPMILGVDFLRAHRVYVAHSQRKVHFTYVGGPVFSHKADRARDQERSIAAYNESLRANPKTAAINARTKKTTA